MLHGHNAVMAIDPRKWIRSANVSKVEQVQYWCHPREGGDIMFFSLI